MGELPTNPNGNLSDPLEYEGGEPWASAAASGGRYGPSNSQKASAAATAADMGRLAGSSGLAGMAGFGSMEVTGPFGLAWGGFWITISLGAAGIAQYQDSIADDPPRSDFKDFSTYTYGLKEKALHEDLPDFARRLAEDTLGLASLTNAMLESIERAQGAKQARERTAARDQMLSAQYCWDLAEPLWLGLPKRMISALHMTPAPVRDAQATTSSNEWRNALASVDASNLGLNRAQFKHLAASAEKNTSSINSGTVRTNLEDASFRLAKSTEGWLSSMAKH